MPTLVDGDLVITESRAILTYLVDKYAPNHNLYPQDVNQRAKIDEVLYIDSGVVTNTIRGIIKPVIFDSVDPSEEAVTAFKNMVKLLNTLLEGKKYFAGPNRTVADLSILAQLNMANLADLDNFEDTPNVNAWYKRLANEVHDNENINVKAVQGFKDILLEKKAAAQAK